MTKQRILTYPEFDKLLTAWVDDHQAEYAEAFDMWCNYVQPRPQYNFASDQWFHEWLAYDYVTEECSTIAYQWQREDESLHDWVTNEQYTRIRAWDFAPDEKTVMYLDLYDGDLHVLVDPFVWQHENWAEGSLGIRLAMVDGVWYVAGTANLHDNQPVFNFELYTDKNRFIEEVRYVIGDHEDNAHVRSVEHSGGKVYA